MNNISFKANININLAKIQTARASDKFFTQKVNEQNLDNILLKVNSLSSMQENSDVHIIPRLNNNILNIICKVQDEKSIISTTIKERSARRLAQDKSFSERFLQNIAMAIRNVDKTKICILEVNDFIIKSQTLKDDKFIRNLPEYVLKSFNNNINPTERLISVLKRIEMEYPSEINTISIKNIANKSDWYKQSRINTFFCIHNKQVDKKVPINYILKDPIENIFL